jgi:hypothetical protein
VTALCTIAVARAACRRLSPSFPRVWCPELSMLDAEVDGERWLWHVPARAANDVEAGEPLEAPTTRKRRRCGSESSGEPENLSSRPVTALVAWLREQEGSVLP